MMRYSLIVGLTCAAFFADVTAAAAKKNGPPGALSIVNASAEALNGLVITAGDKTATLSKPLAPKKRIVIKLPKMNGCAVSVVATFEGGNRSGADALDICKEKLI